MEKINIAELLKDCPLGMELDCTMYENVHLIHSLESNIYPIKVETPEGQLLLNKYGCCSNSKHAKCVIFPKGKTTWDGFVSPCKFKDGDIIYTLLESNFDYISIFKKASTTRIYSYVDLGSQLSLSHPDGLCMREHIKLQRLATESEKAELFKTIKDNGYKWNEETKTLEKLVEPEFKDGDILATDLGSVFYLNTRLNTDECFGCYVGTGGDGSFHICAPFAYKECCGFATEKEKEKLFKAIKEKGYKWNEESKTLKKLVPNKFDIGTLKPFDKVLVRHDRDNMWCGSFFSHIDRDYHSHCYKFVTTAGKSYPMCIPYKNNEHLLGNTDDCDEFYKTWE